LISGSDDLTIRYWDLRTKQCIKVFEGHVGQIQCLQVFFFFFWKYKIKEINNQ